MGPNLRPPQLENVYTHYREGFKALEQAASLAQTLCEEAVKLGASSTGLNPSNALKAVVKAAHRGLKVDETARQLGYTSVEVALKALGQRKAKPLPALYDVAPPQWVQPARLERVRNGLRERTYKVPAVGPKQAQALLRGVRPLLEQLYELWEGDELRAVEAAYKTLSYEEFLSEAHLAVYEALTGEVREEVDEAPSPPAEETTVEDALAAVTHTPNYGVEQLV